MLVSALGYLVYVMLMFNYPFVDVAKAKITFLD